MPSIRLKNSNEFEESANVGKLWIRTLIRKAQCLKQETQFTPVEDLMTMQLVISSKAECHSTTVPTKANLNPTHHWKLDWIQISVQYESMQKTISRWLIMHRKQKISKNAVQTDVQIFRWISFRAKDSEYITEFLISWTKIQRTFEYTSAHFF